MTDLPDAVVEAAAEGIGHDSDCSDVRTPSGLCTCGSVGTARAALAAASGPWAEHLDAANAERDDWKRNYDDQTANYANTAVALEAALARNAELEREANDLRQKVAHLQKRLEVTRETIHRQSEEQGFDGLLDQRDAARAELDNLRETLAQKIETAVLPIDHTKTATVVDVQRECAAIVRGSDDEAGEDA